MLKPTTSVKSQVPATVEFDMALKILKWDKESKRKRREEFQKWAAGWFNNAFSEQMILCADCEMHIADYPGDLCPGCDAYREHTGQF